MGGKSGSGAVGRLLSDGWLASASHAVGPGAFVFPCFAGLVRDELSGILDGNPDVGRAISSGCGGSPRDRRNLSGTVSGDNDSFAGADNRLSSKPSAGTDRGRE